MDTLLQGAKREDRNSYIGKLFIKLPNYYEYKVMNEIFRASISIPFYEVPFLFYPPPQNHKIFSKINVLVFDLNTVYNILSGATVLR